jgi:DNA-binding IclR family transcriptional regulator
MTVLSSETDESVHLSVLDGLEVVYMDKIESAQAIRSYTTIGGRGPAWCVATGKAMLAASGRDAHDFGKLKRFTPTTVIDPEKLNNEFAKIRSRGYAINRGEWREGVVGIAAAIVDGAGEIVAGIGISGPEARFKQKQLKSWSELVVKKALEVSRELGGLKVRER